MLSRKNDYIFFTKKMYNNVGTANVPTFLFYD